MPKLTKSNIIRSCERQRHEALSSNAGFRYSRTHPIENRSTRLRLLHLPISERFKNCRVIPMPQRLCDGVQEKAVFAVEVQLLILRRGDSGNLPELSCQVGLAAVA